MRTLPTVLSALSLVTLSSACSPRAPGPERTERTYRAVDEITVPSAIAFNPAVEGVVQVRLGASTLCTGVMLDAYTVLTGGSCVGPTASSFRVQLGAEVLTPSRVRFSNSGVAVLDMPRRFAAMAPGFVRRISTRTPDQMAGHAMSCLAYNGSLSGGAQLVSASMTASRDAGGGVRLTPTSGLTGWARFDQGTICMDTTAGSRDLDVMVLDASVAEFAIGAAGGGGIGGWVDFVRAITLSQRALNMRALNTNSCLAFDYANGRIAMAGCNPGDPQQGLYQESSWPLVRLRGADSGACVRNVGNVMRYAYCANTAPVSADRFSVALNADGATYRIVNGTLCASANFPGVTFAACNPNDARQKFSMWFSAY